MTPDPVHPVGLGDLRGVTMLGTVESINNDLIATVRVPLEGDGGSLSLVVDFEVSIRGWDPPPWVRQQVTLEWTP